MRRFMPVLLVILLFGSLVATASDDTEKRIDELSEKVDELSVELNELTAVLRELVDKSKEMADNNKSKTDDELIKAEVAAEQNQINDLLSRIEQVVQTQNKIVKEIEELKDDNKPEPLYDEDGNEVYLGVVEGDSSSDAPVLEYYGNANDSDSGTVYYEDSDDVEPYQQRSRVGVRFYFGSPPAYYDDWDGPWAITPPWWVRQQYYRRRYRRW